MKIKVLKSNIINVTADAIVLPANTELKEGSGASTEIFKAAGRKMLTRDCKKIGHCPVGSAVPTLAYNLNAKYIIHAVVPRWIDGTHDEYNLLTAAYLSALNIADVLGCESIAFPLLASGNNGYDVNLAFQIAKESIETFQGINLKHVSLVIFNGNIASIVKEQGYDVIEIPHNILKDMQRKGAGQKFLEDQIQNGMNYLKDEENREKILAEGKKIAAFAFNILLERMNKKNEQK